MITGRGNQRKRVEALEANHPQRFQADEDDDAMLLIWEVLECYPPVKAELERVKGIRHMCDEEALPLMLDTLDNYPEVKSVLIKSLR